MKPNDKAIEAARKAYCEAAVSPMEMALEAAYAAQFPPSEDYAGLISALRTGLAFSEKNNDAADALEAVLAERDALKAVVEIYEKKLNGIEDEIRLAVQSAIAAVRPHIEEAERERCAKIAEAKGVEWDRGDDGCARAIAAAIRSGK